MKNPVSIVENRVCFLDGTCRWLQWTNRAILNDDGAIIEYQVVGRDITEKKNAEDAMLVKDLAVGASVNGIAIADLNGIVTYANPAYLRMFGYQNEADVIGKHINTFAHDDSIQLGIISEVITSILKTGSWSGEITPRREDGTSFYAILTASLVKDPSGTPFCMMASFADITDIRKAQEEIQLKNTAIASSINAIAIFDADQRLIYANDSFFDQFGYSINEIRGRSPGDIITRNEIISPPFGEIDSAIRTNGKWKGEIAFRKKDGSIQYMEASFRTTVNGEGHLLYMLASFVDITDHREAETALRSSRQKLEETIEFMPDPTFIVDRTHRIIAWNRAIEALTGIKREDVLGKEDFQNAFSFFKGVRPVLVSILDLPPHELAGKYPAVRRFGDSLYVEAFIPDMNGGKGAYLWGKASALIDHEGHPIGAIESIRDISAWKRARETLNRAETAGTAETLSIDGEEKGKLQEISEIWQELFVVLDLMGEAFLLTDKSGKIIWANKRFVELAEGEREIVLGAHLSMFFPRDEQVILGEYSTASPGRKTLLVNLIPLVSNKIVPVEARAAALPGKDERVIILQQRSSGLQ
jgi:PAS domain S-box-containing protein